MMQIKIKYILIATTILFCINYIYSYRAAMDFQKKLIEQFENGYMDYLSDINDGNIDNISKKISDTNFLVKDSINAYIEAKEGIKTLEILNNDINLKFEITDNFIISNFFNRVYIKFSFIEKAYYNNNQIYYLGNKGNYTIQLVKENGEWKAEYVKRHIKEKYSYA